MITTPTTSPMHPMLEQAAGALTRADLRWLVLRIPDGGLRAPNGDVDLLVHPHDRHTAVGLLERLGFVRLPRDGPDIHVLQYDLATDRWLWLHLTCTITFARLQVAVRGVHGCLWHRRLDGAVPRPDADTEFWSLLWHCLADKGGVPQRHRDALQAAAVSADCGGRIAHAFGDAAGDRDVTRRLLDAVIHDDWSAVDLEAAACQRAEQIARVGSPLSRLRRGVARRAGALRRWRSRRGISVAVVGADGSGKTTLAAGLHRNLPVRSVVIYMGLTGGAIRRVARLRVPGVVFLATAVVLWARYLRACSHLLRGRIVIFERYVYDGVAPPGRPFRPFERISRRLLRQICPAPDLVLVLDAPGEEMYARKGEYDAATLEQWRGAFRSLSARPNVRIIDASRSADAVRADALALIWAVWSERLRAARSRDRRAS